MPGCRLLGMTAGSLFDAEADRSVSTVGNPIPRRLARLALATDGALALDDLRGVPYLGDAEFGEQPPCVYIGTAIEVGGVRYGSLSFASDEPRAEPFTPSDRDLVQLMGVLVSSAIERGHSRARLKHLAYNDQLTALPNRAWFVERLRDELVLARAAEMRVAVMFLDLDRFKDINDSLGHALGDRMLRMIGDRLTDRRRQRRARRADGRRRVHRADRQRSADGAHRRARASASSRRSTSRSSSTATSSSSRRRSGSRSSPTTATTPTR